MASPVAPSAAQAAPAIAVARAETEAAARRHLEAALREWQRKYPEVSVAQDVAGCHPARVLASLSARADLVVIGRHGTACAPDGSSVRHAVLSRAHGPVAIVPAAAPGLSPG